MKYLIIALLLVSCAHTEQKQEQPEPSKLDQTFYDFFTPKD